MNTNTRTPYRRTALWPLLGGALCALLGLVLLQPTSPGASYSPKASAAPAAAAPTAAPTAVRTADPTPSRTLSGTVNEAAATPLPSPHPTASAAASAGVMPVAGDGPAGDYAFQQVLERSSPADLPHTQEVKLVALASRIWLADVTGAGRENWRGYFGEEPLRSPYRDVRIQAGIARTVGDRSDRVRVRLVWAGTDPAGEKQDGRPAEVILVREDTTWEPVH
ncbi:hypothetical protein [Streptomyces sp. TRM68367]|uniref:hypothetical protein n=1 Tax=Streptomyces sp. TRM68367 TaxID=2758415 RepID=UPI00165B710B|nr:hypothetical protein [Streptomyces sp. TRM68367]MBC9729314.1 hypothetical protein [Streptomyces sp. TRM68367]